MAPDPKQGTMQGWPQLPTPGEEPTQSDGVQSDKRGRTTFLYRQEDDRCHHNPEGEGSLTFTRQRQWIQIPNLDPTNTRFTSIKDFLRKLKKRGEINEQEYKLMFPENAKMGRAHGTAKVHKDFERIPPLRPIVF